MRHGATKLIFGDLFEGHGLDYVRPGNKHVRSLVDHQHEVGDGRRIDGTSGAWSHDRRNLRNHAAIQRVAQENVGIPRQRHHAFLNPRPARIIQPNHRRAHFRRQVHDLHDLSRIRLRQRSAEHREVLGKHIDQPPLNAAVASDKSVAVDFLLGHAEIIAPVRDQFVGLLERALIEQELDPLARRHLSFFVLALAALGPAAILGELVALVQLSDFLFEIHGDGL